MIIYLVRHGEDENDVLTDLGKEQIEVLSKTLKQTKFDCIFSSPLERCKQTAKILKKKLGINQIIIDERLKERQYQKSSPKSQQEWELWNNYLNTNYKNQNFETCGDFFERVFLFLNHLKTQKKDKVLVVGHSALVYAFLSYFYGIKNGFAIWNGLTNSSCIMFELV